MIASLWEYIFILPPFIIIVPKLSLSSSSGSDLIPLFSPSIFIFPSLIVIKLSQAKAFFPDEIVNILPFMVNEDFFAPFISFFGWPDTLSFTSPLIIKDELPLN